MLFSRVILFAVTALATPLSISPRQSGLLNGRGVVGITMPQANGQAGYLDANAQYTTNESGKVIFTATNGVLSINGRNVGHGNNGQMAISADNPFIFSVSTCCVRMAAYQGMRVDRELKRTWLY